MKKNKLMYRFLTLILLLSILGTSPFAYAQESSWEMSDEAIEEFWKMFDPEGYAERSAKDHSALLGVGMETFQRYDALLSELDMGLTDPYEREEVEPGWENIFYDPIEGLFVKAGLWDNNDENPPYYIIGAKSNDSFDRNELWNLMAVFLKAVNPELTDLAYHELMRELIYSCSSLDVGGEMGIIYYGPWRLMLSILPNGDGVDGPTLFIAPQEEAAQEPWNSSNTRIAALLKRFLFLARDDGFDMNESPEREYSQDTGGYQYMWEYMPKVWWIDMYFADMYLGSLINVAKASPHHGRSADLYVNMLVAAFPHMDREDARELYEELNEKFLSEGSSANHQATIPYDEYWVMMSESDGQVAVGVINPFDPAALEERMSTR